LLAGHFPEPGRIELVDIAEPELAAGETGQIIFQPECTCLCGSDLPAFRGSDEWQINVGHSLHEMTGTITATNGSRWKAGDRVLAVPLNQEGLQERFVLDENRAISMDSRVSEEECMLAQPLGTAIYALKKINDWMDKDVVVVGQGPMGQLFNASLRNLGARNIIGIDLEEARLAQSPTFGATATVCVSSGGTLSIKTKPEDKAVCNATADTVAAVREILGGQLPDIVIEAVGHYDQQFNLCIELCKHAGRILYFGVPPETINVRWRDLLFKNITVHTSISPDFARDFPLAMQWIGEGRIDVKPLITHRFPLSKIQEAFEVFRDKQDGALKVLVEFPSWQHKQILN
jgi:threonine dehydrogenase-like Zn-dependent dehydrogenase